jgi:hypothetical protein
MQHFLRASSQLSRGEHPERYSCCPEVMKEANKRRVEMKVEEEVNAIVELKMEAVRRSKS